MAVSYGWEGCGGAAAAAAASALGSPAAAAAAAAAALFTPLPRRMKEKVKGVCKALLEVMMTTMMINKARREANLSERCVGRVCDSDTASPPALSQRFAGVMDGRIIYENIMTLTLSILYHQFSDASNCSSATTIGNTVASFPPPSYITLRIIHTSTILTTLLASYFKRTG
eukprot:scaffold464_cov181-Amphora_coffeaeformis.AAC.11